MITNVKYSNGNRYDIINYLKKMKETNPNYKIIDEGCHRYMDRAMEYDVYNIISYGEKIKYETYIKK